MTSTNDNVYPEYIMSMVRQSYGLNREDTSIDDVINQMPPDKIFYYVCTWNGFIGYASEIRSWVEDIYGVSLNANQ